MNKKELPEGFTMHEDGRKTMVVCKECNDAFKQAFRFRIIESKTDDPREQYPDVCAECASKDPVIVKEHFDGAKTLEYPIKEEFSEEYSTRTYQAYKGCQECEGSGRVFKEIEHRFTSNGLEKEPAFCPKCSTKFHQHPLRKAKANIKNELEDNLNEYYNGLFEDRLEERGLTTYDVNEIEENHQELMDHLSGLLKRKKTELEEKLERRFNEAKEMKTDEGVEHIKEIKEEFSIKYEGPSTDHNIPKKTEQKTLV